MTRDAIKLAVRNNLEDEGVTFWQEDDLNDSMQDGYDDIAVVSGCIPKSATVNFANEITYYNFRSLISDYFSVVAIYNNNSNRWLLPDSRRAFDEVRRDWEIWSGQPQFFSPIDSRRVAIIPRLAVGVGNMTVFYRATADTLIGSSTPLVHTDDQTLLEWYTTADMLDQQQEYIKAENWWAKYFVGLTKYKVRIGKLAQSDYLPQLSLR